MSSQGRAGSNDWKWPRLLQGGTLARQSQSQWADSVTVWEDSCTDPPSPSAAQPPTHPLLYQLLKRDHPSLLKGVSVWPPSMCMLVPFGSTPHHAAVGLFAYCPQSHPSLLLLGSPSPSPPRPPACWQRPDTFFCPDPQAPTHTVLCECFPTVSWDPIISSEDQVSQRFSALGDQVSQGWWHALFERCWLHFREGRGKVQKICWNQKVFPPPTALSPSCCIALISSKVLFMCLCSFHSSWGEWRSVDVYWWPAEPLHCGASWNSWKHSNPTAFFIAKSAFLEKQNENSVPILRTQK